MKRFIWTVAVLLVLASPASAAWMCITADAFKVPAGSSCTKVPIDSGIADTFGSSTVIRCPTTGTPVAFAHSVVPADMPDAMAADQYKAHWLRGTATTGNGCWSSALTAIRVTQEFPSDNTASVHTDAVAIGSTAAALKTGTGGAVTILDGAGTGFCNADTPAECRLQPLIISMARRNSGCTSNADNSIDFVSICFEY